MTDTIAPHFGTNDSREIVILIVEDDPIIRMWAEDELSCKGHLVFSAPSADDALLALHQNCLSLYVLFTDVRMPDDMDGVALAHYVQQHWPWIKILIASGDAQPQQMPSGSRFLPKPYETDHVLHHMHEMMSVSS